jgi:hypothetical protein
MQGDPRPRSLPGCQPALGNELRVGLGDGVAGDAEIARQGARWREEGARAEAAALHGLAKAALEGLAQVGAVELDV